MQNGKALNLRYSKQLLALLPLFVKMVRCIPTLSIVKVIKARSAGEPALVTLVSQGAVAAGA